MAMETREQAWILATHNLQGRWPHGEDLRRAALHRLGSSAAELRCIRRSRPHRRPPSSSTAVSMEVNHGGPTTEFPGTLLLTESPKATVEQRRRSGAVEGGARSSTGAREHTGALLLPRRDGGGGGSMSSADRAGRRAASPRFILFPLAHEGAEDGGGGWRRRRLSYFRLTARRNRRCMGPTPRRAFQFDAESAGFPVILPGRKRGVRPAGHRCGRKQGKVTSRSLSRPYPGPGVDGLRPGTPQQPVDTLVAIL
jgi:hypothetical protein